MTNLKDIYKYGKNLSNLYARDKFRILDKVSKPKSEPIWIKIARVGIDPLGLLYLFIEIFLEVQNSL